MMSEWQTHLLGDEHGNQQNSNSADNSEDEDDTGFTGSPVLALDDVGDDSFAACDEGHVDGGHCD